MIKITRSSETISAHDASRRRLARTWQLIHLSVADQFEVMVFWMGDEPMLRGRTYLLRAGASDCGRDRRSAQVQVEPEQPRPRRGDRT